MTNITLTDQEARMFLVFQEHHQLFCTLHASGVFNIRNGVAQLNFDSSGQITDIDCSFKLYKHGLPLTVDLHKISSAV